MRSFSWTAYALFPPTHASRFFSVPFAHRPPIAPAPPRAWSQTRPPHPRQTPTPSSSLRAACQPHHVLAQRHHQWRMRCSTFLGGAPTVFATSPTRARAALSVRRAEAAAPRTNAVALHDASSARIPFRRPRPRPHTNIHARRLPPLCSRSCGCVFPSRAQPISVPFPFPSVLMPRHMH